MNLGFEPKGKYNNIHMKIYEAYWVISLPMGILGDFSFQELFIALM